jgi:uncharacterized membrane protein
MLDDGGPLRHFSRERTQIVNNPTRMISGTVALAGFVVAVVAGMAVENPASTILTRALLAMLACNLLGSAIGAIAHWTGAQHVERHVRSTPIPSMGNSRSVAVADDMPEKKLAA